MTRSSGVGPTAFALAMALGLGISLSACGADSDSGVSTGHSGEPADNFVHNGYEWKKSGKAVFDERTLEEIQNDRVLKGRAESGLTDVDPRNVTDEEWAEMVAPVGELAGYEYRMTQDSLLAYSHETRMRAIDRLKNGDVGGAPGEPAPGDAVEAFKPPVNGLIIDGTLDDSGVLGQKGIIGSDNRIPIDGSRGTYPFNNIAASGTEDDQWCTYFKVINHHTAATAAHCVHTGSGWKPRRPLRFYATSTSQLPTLPQDCYWRWVPGEWISHPNLPKNDYAALALRGGGTPAASCPLDGYNVGYLGWASVGYLETTAGFVAGYPASATMPPPYRNLTPPWPHLFYHWLNGAQTGVFQANVLQYDNDTTGGQSGAPYVTTTADGAYVRGIHGGEVGYLFVEHNQGREFNSTVADFVSSHGGS